MKRAVKYLPWLIALIALASALYAWYHPKPSQQGQTEFVEVPVPKPYKVISKQTVTVEVIKVITKTEIKEKWPDWFKSDENQQLTAIGIVEPYKGKTECASVISLQTGESRIVTKQLPMPLFGFMNEKELGFRYGTEVDVFGRWTFLRVGSIYLAGYAQAGSSSMAQLELSYRW
jgi:hypothetical protein